MKLILKIFIIASALLLPPAHAFAAYHAPLDQDTLQDLLWLDTSTQDLQIDPSSTQGSQTQYTYQYDNSGNVINNGIHKYAYNNLGQMSEVKDQQDQLIATYQYDARGLRTQKVLYTGGAPTQTILYVYDLNNNLISEISGDTATLGNTTKNYAFTPTDVSRSRPVAQVSYNGTPTLTYLHTDHLNTPRLGTNTAGQAVWSWDADAFGTTAPNEDPDNNSTTVQVNLRMPGQYYDAETGLHYNHHRYYQPDPAKGGGRYLQSDPIGLAGGLNTYVYVGNNPLGWIDPDGKRGTRGAINPRSRGQNPYSPRRQKGTWSYGKFYPSIGPSMPGYHSTPVPQSPFRAPSNREMQRNLEKFREWRTITEWEHYRYQQAPDMGYELPRMTDSRAIVSGIVQPPSLLQPPNESVYPI